MNGDAVGSIGELLGVIVGRDDGRGVGGHQRQVSAATIELKPGVQRLIGDGDVVAGGENHQIAIAAEALPGGDLPMVQVIVLVGEEVAAQVDGGGVGVIDFDPIGGAAEIVDQAVGVAGQEFGDEVGKETRSSRLQNSLDAVSELKWVYSVWRKGSGGCGPCAAFSNARSRSRSSRRRCITRGNIVGFEMPESPAR